MKPIRLFLTVVFGMLLGADHALAQQEDNITKATSSLQEVMLSLKQSADQLGMDNEKLASRDKGVEEQIAQLQAQLGKLQAQGNVLDNQEAQLRQENSGHSNQIERLQEENADWNNRTQKLQDQIKSMQQSLDEGYGQDQKSLLQLKAMSNTAPVVPVETLSESPAVFHVQKEKLKLMKMIYESQERQEALHASILNLQKNVSLQPAAEALAHQQLLKEQIKDLETQLAAYPPQNASTPSAAAIGQPDDAELDQMALGLEDLEKDYTQLKTLIAEMTKKAQSAQMTTEENTEGEKLKGGLDDLDRQGESLRVNLDDLRSQMVDLDKRKTQLETMLQQTP